LARKACCMCVLSLSARVSRLFQAASLLWLLACSSVAWRDWAPTSSPKIQRTCGFPWVSLLGTRVLGSTGGRGDSNRSSSAFQPICVPLHVCKRCKWRQGLLPTARRCLCKTTYLGLQPRLSLKPGVGEKHLSPLPDQTP